MKSVQCFDLLQCIICSLYMMENCTKISCLIHPFVLALIHLSSCCELGIRIENQEKRLWYVVKWAGDETFLLHCVDLAFIMFQTMACEKGFVLVGLLSYPFRRNHLCLIDLNLYSIWLQQLLKQLKSDAVRIFI